MNATPVTQEQRELVKLLSLEHKAIDVSKLTGVDYDNVRQIISRNKRNALAKAQTIQAEAGIVTVSQSPIQRASERIVDVLAERKAQSRSLLSQYQVKAATEALAHDKPLSITGQVKNLAEIHAKVWPEEQSGNVQFSLNVLNLNMLSDDETHSPGA